ncbi:DUF4262 domain-containing protein [Hymenobacter cellulosivorans]|uniref:DUF4262 domain-containing protein n=1 Tax=Hymenobacter cellulosivorans TaxID=2932249 RepID=A0ABY4F6H6_9BACT|nr:DUF4262 domain-containing protein [Hymenobacter cellulosivorans]UOQ52138.1 DUF4262 domain-containing protein [Hymenobacter cellulosivorans]
MKNTTRAELAANIKKHRWLVFSVVGDTQPLYSYTVGLFETFGHPEVVLSGLDIDLAQDLLNDIGNTVAQGLVREPDGLYDDVLDNYPCLFKAVPVTAYEQYFGRALVFYGDSTFPVLQCLWPDAQSRFPGDEDYNPFNQEALFK